MPLLDHVTPAELRAPTRIDEGVAEKVTKVRPDRDRSARAAPPRPVPGMGPAQAP
ncbi:hypothetical protein [Streptomyces sp. NPDC047706]|uniref:hypothetical protein n=1 Tax=Streptomyces sp. NPDC047706 TaxID=3365486 RepID=UPI00371F5572